MRQCRNCTFLHSVRSSPSLRVFALRGYSARVFVVECELFCARQSRLEESFQAAAIESIATEMDISVSSHGSLQHSHFGPHSSSLLVTL